MSLKEITKEHFGKTSDGKDVYVFILRAGGVTVRVLNFGCVVKEILVPDKDGNITDICLGHDTFEGYEDNPAFLGAICGRVANRIDGATFELDGKRYDVSKNDPLGNNLCHGGFVGFTRRCFDWKIDGFKLILTYTDVDGAEGFPGDVDVTVTYELTSDAEFMMDYQATTNKATPIDMANHFMVNLAGHDHGYVGDHIVTSNSSEILEFNERFIPTGKILSVEGSLFDFRKPVLLGDVLERMPGKDGLHHSHLVQGHDGQKRLVARAEHKNTGRYLEVWSTEPQFVAYSCFYLDFLLKGTPCKAGHVYQKSGGILFMPHKYPNAVNVASFPSVVVRPGETYHASSSYKFGVTRTCDVIS
ncbi:galactose mutarotase-like [Mya arenaria]|uniref:galactose mutarotase-like n=1 Tax=Mya arenaria TaxID=6604 RepID=UPI0022E96935|nr:galactose mutarotase-like [Mya arenaria]